MRLIPTNSGKLWAASKADMEVLFTKPPRIIFDLIWNLAAELDAMLPLEKDYAKWVLWGNIRDYNVPSNRKRFAAQLNEIHQILGMDGKAVIHCWGGHGRTGMVIACLLKEMDHNLPTEEALKIARTYCKGPETVEQVKFVMDRYK